MNRMKTITVLDYESGKVTQYNVDKWKIDTEDVQSFLFLYFSQNHWIAFAVFFRSRLGSGEDN